MSVIHLAATWKDVLEIITLIKKHLSSFRAQLFMANLHTLALKPKLFLRLSSNFFFPCSLLLSGAFV